MQRTSFVSAAGGILEVHPAHRARARVERDVRLGDDGVEPVVGELVLAERAGEESAVVLSRLDVDDERALQLGLGEDHPAAPFRSRRITRTRSRLRCAESSPTRYMVPQRALRQILLVPRWHVQPSCLRRCRRVSVVWTFGSLPIGIACATIRWSGLAGGGRVGCGRRDQCACARAAVWSDERHARSVRRGCRLRNAGTRRAERGAVACRRTGAGRHDAGRVPGDRRLQRAHEPDGGPLRGRRPRLRRGEERPDQGLRQPHRPDADGVRRPPHERPQLLGSRAARDGAAPELPDDAVRVRPLHVRPPARVAATPAPRWGDDLPDSARPDLGRLRGQRTALASPGGGQRDDGQRAGARRGLVPAVSEPLGGHRRVRPRRALCTRAPATARASPSPTTARTATRSTPAATRRAASARR